MRKEFDLNEQYKVSATLKNAMNSPTFVINADLPHSLASKFKGLNNVTILFPFNIISSFNLDEYFIFWTNKTIVLFFSLDFAPLFQVKC